MSNRAAQAYDDGKLTYSKLPTWAKRMVDAGMAKTDEWHHTSSYGNETPFYEVKQFFDHLTDAEKEKLGVDDFESFKDVPKDVIKEIDVKSKEALKKKNNIKEVRKGYVDAAQKELNDFNAKFKSFSRVSKSPEHGIVSSYEMNGKYGWFEATSRYNLPEYQSGIDYETAANRQKAVELESKLSTAKNEPIYKIELQKRGFDENEINELKKSGIIHSEIMPESFYANAERNKDIIKKQVKELSELPKPVAEFNPRFGKSTENFLTDAEKQARQNRHYSISEQGENFGSSYERRLAHEDNDNEYSRIAGERYDKAKQEFLNSDEVQKQEEKFNEDKAKAADITGNLKHLFGIEDGQPLFKDAEAQYRIESGKNIIEAIKDFTKAENKAEATVALTHEIMHPTVVAIIDGAKEGNEVGLKHTKTIVDEFNKKVRENNSQLKLSQDAEENDYANSKLTEEDNIEQEPSIKAIEGKAESDSKAELNEAIEQVDTKINAATDVKVILLKFISTDEARFQNRDSLNKQVVKDIAENWKDADQDPIHIWTDPKNGKTYVLSGHHRYYGAKEAGRETVKTVDRTNDFTEAEAIKFAKEEANANRSMETSLERAKALREKIKRGDSKDEINKFLEREGKNKTYIQNIAALNPKGKTIQTVEQFDNAGDRQTQKETEQRADWIGEARRTINGLTDAHENEMFDFLFDKDASKRVTTKSDFLQKVRSVVKPLEPSEPLNIARFKQKTTGEEAYDEAVNIKKAEIADKQEKINTLNDRFSNPQNKDYISTDSKDYQELRKIANEKISQFESERKQLQKQLEDIYRDKGKYTGAASSGTLFKDDSEIPFDKEITEEDLIKWNDDFKAGKTNEQYRAVQEFIAKAWEEYNTKGGKGFSEAFQKFLDQITEAFKSVYKSITGKNLTPELNKMFDEILGKEQAKSIQETIDKKENVSLINKIKNYAAEVIANREKISRLSEQAEQGRKEGGIRNVEATLLLTTGGEKYGQVKGREAQQQIIEKYAKEEGIWHDNIDVEPKIGKTQEGLGIFKDSGVENQVYIPTENPHIVRKAMKTTDPFNKDNPNEVLYQLDSRISEHNAGLGSSVPYKVVGFGRMSDGSFVVITEQPHIQDARLATKAEIKKEMLNRGYEQDGKDSFGDENHFITDVNPKNVLVDKNGNLHFTDTIYDILYDVNEGDRAQMPKFNATTEAKGVTPEQTERANRILDFLKLTVAYFKGGKNIITDAKEYARAVLEIFEANNLEDIRHSFISNKNANLFSGSFNGKTLADNFNKAVEMDGNGEPSERIKFATGWYKAGDGKWRYEVTDKNAKLKVSLPNKGETIATKLEDILDHPRLFEIYPQLKNTDVIITNNNINSDYGGFFISEHGSNSTPTIHVNTRGEINATVSELIHEVQHNVQAISGLTPGNNNEAILGRLKDEFRSEHGRNPNTNEERKLFIEANREYLGTYGEIEARASQHNIHITENERLFNSTIAGTIKRFEIKPEDVSFPKQKIEINKGGNVINFLSTSQGEVYGFVSEGKMYLDPAKLTSELVTEEFTHIQQQALRLAAKQGDKKAQKIVSAWDNATNRVADEFIKGVRGNNMSEYVRDLLNLLGITKAEMASEVYQKQPNESAAAYKTRLQDELWAKAQKPEFAKHLEKLASENKLTAITRKIYEALKDFYRYVINRFTNEDLSKLSLLELIKRANRELTKGNWLSVLEKGKSIVEAGNNMQAQAQQGQPLFMAESIPYLSEGELIRDKFGRVVGIKEGVVEAIQSERKKIETEAKANGAFHKAPNGEQSKLSEAQWVTVRTERFKKWFGDWETQAEQKAAQEKIEKLLSGDKDTSKGVQRETIGRITPEQAKVLKDALSIDAKGFKHTIEKSMINHAINNHGYTKQEENRGQIAITESDFSKIPEVLNNPDKIEYSGKNDKGLETIKYTKAFNGETIIVEEVRTGKKELAFNTMYKKKTGSEQLNKPSLLTSETTSKDEGTKNNDVPKVVDFNGEPLNLYHQTGEAWTEYNFDEARAGKYDGGMPTGIFLKPTDKNIGVGGDIQMTLFANIRNPMLFKSRESAENFFNAEVEGYYELGQKIKGNDIKYSKHLDEAEKKQHEEYKSLREDAIKRNIQMPSKEWSDILKNSNEQQTVDAILDEWKNSNNVLYLEQKKLINNYYKNSDFDGVHILHDDGSMGRSTETYIAFSPSQIKSSIGNKGTFSNETGDIRFMAVVGEKANLKQTVRDNLYTARQMEASKVDSNTIYLATGWERGNDGKWNYEIPDMQFKDNELIEKEITLVLENKKDHYEAQLSQIEGDNPLTERYPQLRGTILQFVYEPGVSFKGEYDANVQKVDGRMGTVISINTARLDEAVKQYGLDKEGGGVYSQRRLAAHSILIHELQHAIQDIEGFANGGNGAIARKIIFEKVENEIKNLAAYKTLLNKEQELQSQGKMLGDPEFEKLQDDMASFKIKYAAQMTKSGTLKESEYETYKSLTGEVQARNVQGRLKMTEAQRRQTAISETEDVSRKDQIIYFRNEGTVQKVNDISNSNTKFTEDEKTKYYTDSKGEEIPFKIYSPKTDDRAKSNLLQREEDKAEDNGDFVLVERQFIENKNLDFTAGTKIESLNDVAWLFRNLENEAVEQTFVVYIKDDGSYSVQHMSTGGIASTVLDGRLIIGNAVKYGAKSIAFVHNHPSGRLMASNADKNSYANLKGGLEGTGIDILDGVIINLKSGKYVTFNGDSDIVNDITEQNQVQHKVKVLSFSKQIFAENYNPEKITSSGDIAKLLSTKKFGVSDKTEMLILNNALEVVGKFILPEQNQYAKITELIAQYGGVKVVIYGNKIDVNSIKEIDRKLKKIDSGVLDAIEVKSNNYISLRDEGILMEPNSEIQLQAQAKSTVTLERVKKAFNRLVNKTELVKNPKKEILRVSGLMVDLGFPEKQINAVAQTIGADAANLPEAERKIISEKAKKEFEEEKTSSFLEVLDTLSARNVEGNPDAIIDAADWKNTASNIGVDNKRLSSPDNPDTLVKDDRELTILMSGETLKKAGIVFIDDNSLDAENDQLRVKFKLDQKANELENIYFTLGICKT